VKFEGVSSSIQIEFTDVDGSRGNTISPTSTPTDAIEWAITQGATPPNVRAKHRAVANVDKSMMLEAGESLVLWGPDDGRSTFAAVTAQNPSAGNV